VVPGVQQGLKRMPFFGTVARQKFLYRFDGARHLSAGPQLTPLAKNLHPAGREGFRLREEIE